MANLFNTYLYEPILAVLVFIYQNLSFHDLGLAIIILTILVRVVLFPIFYKSAKDQSLMQGLQPHIKKIQKNHKDNKEKQATALMALYRQNKVNPLSGLLLIIIQLPIIIALYQVFLKGLSGVVFDNHTFLGIIDLGAKSLILVVAAALLQYVQGKLSLPPQSSDEQGKKIFQTSRMMTILGPIITLVILISLPSAISLYWAVSTLVSIGQQVYINKKIARPKI